MNSNDVSVSSNDMSDSEQRLMSLDSSQFENLDKEQYENLTSHISCLISVFEDGEERGVFEKDYFSDECNKLSDVVKQIASENNISKIIEADATLDSFAYHMENSKSIAVNRNLNIDNFIKQNEALMVIKDFCKNHDTYKKYEPVINYSIGGIKPSSFNGLPVDPVYICLKSINSSLQSLNFGNNLASGYEQLIQTRKDALDYAKNLYLKKQIDYMDEYVTEHPGKLISREYIQKRDSLIKSVDKNLEETALRLGFEYSNDKSQDQTSQTQEPASNKKAKSSPDLER